MKTLRVSVAAMVCIACLSHCGRSELLDADAGALGVARCGVADVDIEVMRRWNLAVDEVSRQPPDFHWRTLHDFPHATYRGGSAQAYQLFADILLRFWARGDALEFMQCADRLDHGYNSGPPVQRQLVVRLRPLTHELSVAPLVSPEQRAALAQRCVHLGC